MDDLISRQAAIDALEFGITYAKAFNKETGEVKELFSEANEELRKAVERIEQLPPAQQERKTGEWIYIRDEENGNGLYECPICHRGDIHAPEAKVNFCWNCGAKMEGGKDE